MSERISPVYGARSCATMQWFADWAGLRYRHPCAGRTTSDENRWARSELREAALRVVFQMNGEDSANLVNTPAASKLGPHRALFYDEEEGQLEKFRPYGMPSVAWLDAALEQVRARFDEKP